MVAMLFFIAGLQASAYLSDLELGRRNWTSEKESQYREALGHIQGNPQGIHYHQGKTKGQ
jgi:hypothetical protein